MPTARQPSAAKTPEAPATERNELVEKEQSVVEGEERAAAAEQEKEEEESWEEMSYEHAPGIGLQGWLLEDREEFAEVDEIVGVRVVSLDDGRPNLQYHIKWKDSEQYV